MGSHKNAAPSTRRDHATQPQSARTIRARAGRPGFFEPLEDRKFFSTVTWDGGAGTPSWHDAANWSSDVLPTSADDVVIPSGSPTPITISTANAQALSLVSDRAISISSSRTLTISANADMSADLSLSSGTIEGGQWAFSAGGAMRFSTSGGTLRDATVFGDLSLDSSSESVVLAGSTRFATFHLASPNASLRMAPGYTLHDDVVVDSATNGTAEIRIAFGGSGTVTFAADATLTLAPGSLTGLNILQNSTGTLVNQGLISAEASGELLQFTSLSAFTNEGTARALAGTLNISPTSWSSSGALSATDATLTLEGNWSNSGSLVITNATLNLNGAFTTAGMNLPAWTRSGGTVRLGGDLDNTAATLTLNAATGSWTLLGGSISGGTLAFADGSTLDASTSGGTLLDLDVLGDLTLDSSSESVVLAGSTRFATFHLASPNASLRMAPGYTLHDDVVVDAAANGTAEIRIAFGGSGTVTFAADATVTLAPGSLTGLNILQNSTGTLINQGLISADASGELLRFTSLSAFTNEGIARALAGTLNINATTWSSSGALSATDATLTFGGSWSHTGSVTITNATLNLNGAFTTAGMNLAGWTRSGGAVNLGGDLDNASATLTLNAATGSWTLLGGSITGGTLAFADGSTLDASTSGGTLLDLNVLGDLSLDSSSESVVLAGATRFATFHLASPNASLRMAPGYTLHDDVVVNSATNGTAEIRIAFGGPGTVTFAADATVTLAAGSLTSLNILQNSTGTLINQGLISGEATGELLRVLSLDTFTNDGTIQALAGSLTVDPTTLTNYNAGVLAGGTWIAADATLTTPAGDITTNAATIELRGAGAWASINAIAINDGSLTLEGGKDLASPGSFANNGALILGPGSTLTVNGDYTQAPAASIEIRASGPDAANGYGSVNATGQAVIDGAYTAVFVGGYAPTQGTFFDVILGAAGRSGEFSSVTLPTPPSGDKILLIYEGSRVRMLSTDIADLDLNGSVNTQDFLIYLNWFAGNDTRADFNHDGTINTLDFIFYLNLWADG